MKFLLSRELGRLAKWLRILGFDTLYFREGNKSSFIITALRDDRIVLTRNKILVKDKALKTFFVKSEEIREQIKEIIEAFHIKSDAKTMFSRCILCNQVLSRINKKDVVAKIPQYVYEAQENFYQCNQCGRLYWQGTHWGNVQNLIEKIYSL